MKVCIEPDCPRLTRGTRCTEHERARDQARGTREQRGYDTEHRTIRKRYQSHLDRGMAIRCWRCNKIITPDQQWDLGHDDEDRTIWRGPEHAACNRAVAGRSPTTPRG